MDKFKVGDEVKLGGGCARVIHIESTGDFPYLVERADNRIEFCNDAEMMLIAPAIPAGWTSADEPPDGIRDMRVMLKSGKERFGWYSESAILPSCGKWYLYPEGTTPKGIDDASFDDTPVAPGEVIAWREIAAAQVRYAVTYKGEGDSYDFDDENCYSTLESATQAAKRQSVDANKPAEIWKLVAIVNPPAEPEVIRMEE